VGGKTAKGRVDRGFEVIHALGVGWVRPNIKAGARPFLVLGGGKKKKGREEPNRPPKGRRKRRQSFGIKVLGTMEIEAGMASTVL